MERSINYFKVILSLGGADCDHVLILVERSYHFCACAQEFDNFIDLVQSNAIRGLNRLKFSSIELI